ncbi:MAG: MFS transporter [Candidatus Pacearchaeota archaeon]|nr:MAG: MFS transporter [Candidatus Pacearchaeota archaeon]
MPHTHHHSIFHYLLNKELSEIYITIAGKTFALALIAIFIPIYLFQINFELRYIFLFYALVSISFALTVFFSAKLSTKTGIKHGMLISMPFLIGYFILLQFLTSNSLDWIFFLAPILSGIHGSLFWMNFHIDFYEFSSRKLRAEQISGYAIISLILAAIGPVIGGFILVSLGFNPLFIFVSILLFISTIPLFMSKEIYVRREFSIKKVGKVMKKAGISLTGFISEASFRCAFIAWIIIMFLILKGYVGVGTLTSAGLVVAIASTFFVGRLADKYDKGAVLRIGAMLSSLGWFVRLFITTFVGVLGINIFFGAVGPASAGGSAFDAINYDMAKRKHIAEVIVVREITIHTSLALFMLFLFFVPNLYLAIIFGVIGSFLLIPFSFQKKKI